MNVVRRRGGVVRPERRTTSHDRTRRMGVTVVAQFFARAHASFRRLGGQNGATAVEYAIMLMLIAMVVIVAVQFLGQATSNAYSGYSFSP